MTHSSIFSLSLSLSLSSFFLSFFQVPGELALTLAQSPATARLLEERHIWDEQLYQYGKQLFYSQAQAFGYSMDPAYVAIGAQADADMEGGSQGETGRTSSSSLHLEECALARNPRINRKKRFSEAVEHIQTGARWDTHYLLEVQRAGRVYEDQGVICQAGARAEFRDSKHFNPPP